MAERVYIETTFVSYLTARASRDVVIAGHQQSTHEWWDTRRASYELCVSQLVLDEELLESKFCLSLRCGDARSIGERRRALWAESPDGLGQCLGIGYDVRKRRESGMMSVRG